MLYVTSEQSKNDTAFAVPFLLGAPEGIRTPDLLIRSQTLYPAELRAQVSIDDLLPAIADNVCYYTAK